MKIEEIRKMQPALLERFEHVLEQNRLYHAYLFTGNFASFEMALLLAQSLFCTNKTSVLPCGHCRNCHLINEEEFSDVTVVRSVHQTIKTEQIRDLLRNVSQSGLEGTQQVFIICDADKMHTNAANSLLKTMEEPQGNVYLFLLTADEEWILPTIKSRTQIIHFPKQQTYLKEMLTQMGLIKNQVELLTVYSSSVEEAHHLANSAAFFELAQECQRFLNMWQQKKPQAYLQVARLDHLADEKEKQVQVFRLCDILLSKELKTLDSSYLQRVLRAKKMWQANVSFQNALEYMVLQEETEKREKR